MDKTQADEEAVKQELQKELTILADSQEYKSLDKFLTENDAHWENLDASYKLATVHCLRQGNEGMLADVQSIFYKRKVISIEKFLTKEIMGPDADKLYDLWRKHLIEHYSTNNKTYEWVVSGSIGSGKTTFVSLAQIYSLYRMCCLRYPQMTLGAGLNRTLYLALFTVTLEKAKTSSLRPFLEQLKQVTLFKQVKKIDQFESVEKTGLIPFCTANAGMSIVFPNNIEVSCGSTGMHAISNDLFGAVLDESEFRRGGVEDALSVYTNLKERVKSRFLGSRYILVCLVSSAKYTTGVIPKYLKGLNLKTNEYTKHFSYPVWEVKSFDAYKEGHFYVMRGTKTHPSRVLDKVDTESYVAGTFKIPSLCEVIKVPTAYKDDFNRRIETALQNLAGIQTLSGDVLFDDTSKMEHDYIYPEFNLEAPLTVGSGAVKKSLIAKLPQELFQYYPGGRGFVRYPEAPRYSHLDAAATTEGSLCIVHKELSVDTKKTIYVVDLWCWLTSSNRISFHDVANLLIDLKQHVGVNFHTISTDQYQSTHTRQLWEAQSIAEEINHLSVDKVTNQYQVLSSIVDAHCVATGPSPKGLFQLEHIEINENDKIYTTERKDMADSLCGAVYNAMMSVSDHPIYYFGEEKRSSQTAEILKDYEPVPY